jgi:two-component system, OmpR family, phosphate regulon sensor histidine kinase PhoR
MKKIRLLVGLMIVAMLGLILFQYFWLSNAHQTRKAQFDYVVNDALQTTIRKLEKQEIVFLANLQMKLNMQEKMRAQQARQKQALQASRTREERVEQPVNVVVDSFRLNNTRPTTDFMIVESYNQIRDFEHGFFQDIVRQEQFYSIDYERLEAERNERLKSFSNVKNSVSEELQSKNKIPRKTDKSNPEADIDNTVKQVIIGKRSLYERINRTMLDTLLQQEFNSRGISIPYHYGVKDAGNMIFSSFAVNYNPQLLDKAYKVPLFPNDAVAQNQYLYVLFMKKDNFILQNMWGQFLISGLLILIIGYVFYQASTTMLSQKKLADIKNDFVNNMTHEFKTPIATISLATQVLGDEGVQKDQTKIKRYLNIIRDENTRLGKHVEKVLQMALLDRGDIQLKLSTVNIHETIEQVLQNISVLIEQQDGELNLKLDAMQTEVNADDVHLANVFYNLIDNAVKYSKENPKISIETADIQGFVSIKIKDSGLGMSKEQLNKIFDKFYRIPTGNQHDVKGFGLGLSYVKKIVEAHKGQINVESKVDEGSMFEILLPTV